MAKTDLLLSQDFHEFYRVMIQEGHGLSQSLIRGNVSPEYFKGAMEMFRKIIKAPLRYASLENEEQRNVASAMVSKAFADFEYRLMHGLVYEEGGE